MATTYSKVLLSGNPGGGRGLKVAQTVVGSAQTVHTTGISATAIDELWIFAYNSDTVDREIVVLVGGTTQPDDEVRFTVPSKSGWIPVVAGMPLTGDGAAGRAVKVYGAAANVLTVAGFVNRIG